MSVYLDASVILPNLAREASSRRVEAYLATIASGLFIGEFAAAEVASALSRLVRTGEMSLVDANGALASFDAWCASDATLIEVEGADVRLANAFVRRFDVMLRVPDALHVAMSQRLDATLVTLDHRLAAAARGLGVNVATP